MTTSSSITQTSVMENQDQDRDVLLATVDSLKKIVSAYRASELHYVGAATDLLALSVELVTLLQAMEQRAPKLQPVVFKATYRLHRSLRQLLSFWPQRTISQERLLTTLGSDGLETMLDISPEGFPSLSTDQILGNVARAIAVSRERSLKQSSSSDHPTT